MSVSIGLLTYQRTDLLIKTIEDICKTKLDVELIVLNNNVDMDVFSDINNTIVDSNVNLVYLWDKKNHGVSSGRRRLTKAASRDIMILFDDDVVIPDIDLIIHSVLNAMVDPSVYGVAFNIIDYKTKTQNRFEIPHKNKNIDMSKPFNTYVMIGAGHAISVDKSLTVGNYADDFGLYGFEEVDLSFRLVNAGGKIIYLPECVVYHKRSPDGRFSNNQVSYQAFVNRSIMAKRYFPFYLFVSCIVVRGLFYLKVSKDVRGFIKALRVIASDRKYNKFDSKFFNYVKEVKGFLWY
ncbi:glycosyltransferase family 2 protein [Vibrio sp. 10N.286.48.F5]|uniref:glycosyltransferase family 2 protein n=1 Tax=Vibrio sp. 10N.286.48.F5 TaxID=3229699 RepID=UPI003554284D